MDKADIDRLVAQTHRQWLEAKEKLARGCMVSGNEAMAGKLRGCTLFGGTESLPQLCALMLSPQGVEFCLSAGFPSLETLRRFSPLHPERHGIIIDAGHITLTNPGEVLLAGDTIATVVCNDTRRHCIYTIHGAAARIKASGWAVVHAEAAPSATVDIETRQNAIRI